jgi:ATP-dependent RNA helicase DHX29
VSDKLAHKTSSDSAVVDRKIKFQFAPKTAVAIRYLREQLVSIIATRMRNRLLTPEQEKWNELAMMVLRRMKVTEDSSS